MIIIVIIIGLCIATSPVSGRQGMSYKKDGDYVIGALLALQTFDEKSQTCTHITDLGAIRRAESIVYAVTQINRNPLILTNVTLGYEIFDTCYTRSVALKHALSFTKQYRERDNVVGVVGTSLSSTAEITTILLSLYNMTMISHFATSDELSNTDRYPFFMRTVPPDSLQVDVTIDILVFNKWEYVAFIYTETIYGRKAYDTFRKRIKEHNLKNTSICIPFARGMTISDGDSEYNDILAQLENLRNDSNLSVVIVFAELENIEGLFKTANTKKVWRQFIWIGSDSFGIPCLNTVKDVEKVALGAFTIVPKAHRSPEFQDHFDNEVQKNHSSNPWMKEYKTRSGPRIETEARVCPSFESLLITAVDWLARGLDELLTRKCGNDANVSCRDSLLEENRNYLHRDILLNGSYKNFLPSNGNSEGVYEIRQLSEEKGSYKYHTVGNWTSKGKFTINTNITWHTGEELPKSICKEPCLSHQRPVVSEDKPCCWTCENNPECKDRNLVNLNGTCGESCINSSQGIYKWPSKNKSMCIELEESVISKQANSVAIICVSFLGLVLTLLVTYLYVENRENRIIKASSRELGYVILIGVFFNYLAAILYRTKATVVTCVFRKIMPHVATSFIYISIATMTIRLYRIFVAGRKSSQRPNFISPKSQVIITLSLSLIPLTWTFIWMIIEPGNSPIEPPFVKTIEPTIERQVIDKICSTSIRHLAGQLVWQLAVLLVCCVFAFLARHLPENYNQSRFIAFCVFGALVVDIAFAPALTYSDSAHLGIYLSLGAIIHSSIVIVLIFLVRIYAVYYVDLTETTQSSSQHSHNKSTVLASRETSKSFGTDSVEAVNDELTVKSYEK